MLLVDDLAAGGTKNLRHTPRGLVTLIYVSLVLQANKSECMDIYQRRSTADSTSSDVQSAPIQRHLNGNREHL